MRFTRLFVEGVRGIASADITLGPGLNVLYGPNDLGKSTLATALRSALLLPPSSSEGAGLIAWNRDEPARIRLVLVDDAEKIWRVTKTYGDGARAAAELAFSKDGDSFTMEAKGREVDGKLRGLLRWGIPSPGGKGGQRGMPESFLARVLLAEQSEVDEILSDGLAKDDDDTGKLRLTEVLSALAQDPALKRVLATAQAQVDTFFSGKTGQKSRSSSSPLKKCADDVKKWQNELQQVQKAEAESRLTEQRVGQLRVQRQELAVAMTEARDRRTLAEERLARALARGTAMEKLAFAKADLDAHDDLVRGLEKARDQLVGLEQARAAVDLALRNSEGLQQEAEARLILADEALRIARSDDGEKERALAAAEIGKKLADLNLHEQQLLRARAEKERLLEADSALGKARALEKSLVADLERIRSTARKDEEIAQICTAELELVEGIVAYGRWREAADAQRSAELLTAEIVTMRAQVKALEDELAHSPTVKPIPPREQITALRQLEKDLAIAEGSLGGGVAISVRPKKAIAIRSTADGLVTDHGIGTKVVALEADRALTIVLDELVEIDVEVGAAEARTEARKLRERWEQEGAPALSLAGVATVSAFELQVADIEREALSRAAKEMQARQLREKATERESRVLDLELKASQAAAREAAFADLDRTVLKDAFAKMGPAWERQADELRAATKKKLDAAMKVAGDAKSALEKKTYQAEQTRAEVERFPPVPAEEVGRAATDLSEVLAALAAIEPSRAHLEDTRTRRLTAVSERLSEAENAHNVAALGLEKAKVEVAHWAKMRDDARSSYDAASGQASARAEALSKTDRTVLDGRVRALQVEVDELSSDLATETEVLEARIAYEKLESELADVTRQHDNAEGALQRVGGAPVREDLLRVTEALELAKQREHELDTDAEAWKLLRDTLREVENEEGTHLGRALAGPVTERLAELTNSRYGAVEIDPVLKTTGVSGFGETSKDVLAALSVGTKDQLATLLRIAIARELKASLLLDDHLVHSDPARLGWFRRALREAATKTQIVVLTCRPQDYLDDDELVDSTDPIRILAAGSVCAVDLERVIRRW